MGLATQLYKQPVDGEPGRSARDRSQHLYLTQTLVRFGSLADVRRLDSELARKQTWDAPVTSDYVSFLEGQRRPAASCVQLIGSQQPATGGSADDKKCPARKTSMLFFIVVPYQHCPALHRARPAS